MTTLRLHDILIKCHVCGKAIEAAPDRQDVRTAELPNLAAQAPSPQALGPNIDTLYLIRRKTGCFDTGA